MMSLRLDKSLVALLFTFFQCLPAAAEHSSSVFSRVVSSSLFGVIGGEASQNPEVVPVGFTCSGIRVSSNTVITAAHCPLEGRAQLFDRREEKKLVDGKEIVNVVLTPINLQCKAHPRYRPFSVSTIEERLKANVKKTFADWKKGGKKKGSPAEEDFRKALTTWQSYDSHDMDKIRFRASAEYDVAVCALPKPDSSTPSACVIPQRERFDSKKNYVLSGFGVNQLNENGEGTSHEFGSQTQGRARLELGAGDEKGLLRALWKKGSKDRVGAGFADSGGFMGEQILPSQARPRQMRLHGVVVAVDYFKEKFDEIEGDFTHVAAEEGATLAVDLVASSIRKDFLDKPELLPPGAKIDYCR